MAAIDKVFGLILVLAGLTIAIYWTIWQFLSLPILKIFKHHARLGASLNCNFPGLFWR